MDKHGPEPIRTSAASRRTERIWLGALLMIFASLGTGAMSGFSKYAQQAVSPYELLFIQSLLGVICLFPVILICRGWKGFKTTRIATHLFRDFTGVASYLLFFLTVSRVSLVDAMLLYNTGPLFVPFIVWIWSHHRPPFKTWWGVIVGFVGVVLVLHPSEAGFNLVMIVGLASGLFLGLAYVGIRILNQTEWPFLALFYYYLVSTIILLPLALWQWRPAGLFPWLAMLGNAVSVLITLICTTYAFSFGRVLILSALIYLSIVWSGCIDWVFWSSVPRTESLIGAALVIVGGVLSILLRGKPANRVSN